MVCCDSGGLNVAVSCDRRVCVEFRKVLVQVFSFSDFELLVPAGGRVV